MSVTPVNDIELEAFCSPKRSAGELERDVWETVQRLNRAWAVDGAPEKLEEFFAPEMVAITPTDRFRRKGRASCIDGWSGFARAARIHRWVESNQRVVLIGQGRGAVVAYDFEIDFEMNGRLIEMRGRDLRMLDHRDGHWWLVADHYSATPG